MPSLRNVTRTAPYFHDGSVATIEEAVQDMGMWQLGRNLTDDDVAKIVAFLRTLEGAPDEKLISDPFASSAGGPP